MIRLDSWPSLLLALALLTNCSSTSSSSPEDAGLSTAQSELGADNYRVELMERAVEVLLDDPLGPVALVTDPFAAPDLSRPAAESLDGIVRRLPEHFAPASCLRTAREAGGLRTELERCTGPRGRVYSGTIATEVTTRDGCLEVSHAATGLQINTSERTVRLRTRYCADGTRERTWSLSGRTERGDAALQGTLRVRHDPKARCVAQNGKLQGSVAGRAFTRDERERVRCAVDPAPDALTEARATRDASGTVLLTRGSTSVAWTPSDGPKKWGDIVITGEI